MRPKRKLKPVQLSWLSIADYRTNQSQPLIPRLWGVLLKTNDYVFVCAAGVRMQRYSGGPPRVRGGDPAPGGPESKRLQVVDRCGTG